MDTNDPRFDDYLKRFEAIAEPLDNHDGPQADISAAELRLCLFGENLMSPEEELALLEILSGYAEKGLKKATIHTGYWEDVILYVPAR